MRASSKCPRVDSSSSGAPPSPHPPSTSGDPAADASVHPTIAVATPPLSTSNDSNILCMLETVITVQAAHGQFLVDMLDELWSLRADLESLCRSPQPPSFDDE